MGSARGDGNTRKVAERFGQHLPSDLIDLQALDFGAYDYHFANKEDDFLPMIRRVIADYDRIILLTPVYWYTMSTTMKKFLDRISDLLGPHKDLGRQLRGKSMGLISCGSDSDSAPHFSEPFEMSADYLGMSYLGHAHAWVESNMIPPVAEAALVTWAQSLS